MLQSGHGRQVDGEQSILSPSARESGGAIHGGGGTHAVWYQQVPALAQESRVMASDPRGFGRSTRVNEQAGPESAVEDSRRCSTT